MRSVGDAGLFIRSLPDRGVHQAIVDPPWDLGIKPGGWKVRGESVRDGSLPYEVAPPRELVTTLKAFQEKLVPGGYLYCFLPGAPHFFDVLRFFEEDGWRLQRLLIWDKALQGRSGLGATWRNAFEPIVVLTNGAPRRLSERGCWSSMLRQKPRHTRTAKPTELYRVLVEATTEPGELVVDPWAGLDPLAAAAQATGRRWLSNDILTPEEVEAQARER